MTATRQATDRQVAYLLSLLKNVCELEIAVDPENGPEAALANDDGWQYRIEAGLVSVKEASEAIERFKARISYLRAKTYVSGDRKPGLVPEGFYLYNDTVYRVVPNKAGTSRYAKRPDAAAGRWVYAAGTIARLTLDDALTAEEAGRRGRHYGRCVFCNRELSVKDSTERGIGPDCWKKYCNSGKG